MSKFGDELLKGARESLAIAKGELAPARAISGDDIDVAAIRKALGLSQGKFAVRYGLTLSLVRDWEQRRRNPDQAARTLLRLIARDP